MWTKKLYLPHTTEMSPSDSETLDSEWECDGVRMSIFDNEGEFDDIHGTVFPEKEL